MKPYPLSKGMWHGKYLLPPIIFVQSLLALSTQAAQEQRMWKPLLFQIWGTVEELCPQKLVCFLQLY